MNMPEGNCHAAAKKPVYIYVLQPCQPSENPVHPSFTWINPVCAVKSKVYIMDLVFTASSGQAQLGKFNHQVPDGFCTVKWFGDQVGTYRINFFSYH